MKSKKNAIVLSALLLLLALFCVGRLASHDKYDGLFFVMPSTSGMTGIPIERLEEWNGDTLLLTYEILSEKRVKALLSHHDVTMIGTNYAYPYVMRLSVIAGGFFTEAAQENKSRSIVLNQVAAFEMFGSTDIIGQKVTWNHDVFIVTGVVEDQSENKNIYLPAGFLSETTDSLLSVINTSDMNTRNTYQQAGIDDTRYTLVNLQSARESIQEKWIVSLALCLSAALIFTLYRGVRTCIRSFCNLKELSVDLYLTEIGKNHLPLLQRGGLACLIVLLSFTALLMISINMFEIMLGWEDYGALLAHAPYECFGGKIRELYWLILYADILFIAFVTTVSLFLIMKGIQKWRT